MLLRCIRAENRKLHASPIWLVFLVVPAISCLYGTYNFLGNLGLLDFNWYNLWTQHTLFYTLFFFCSIHGINCIAAPCRISTNLACLNVFFTTIDLKAK